MDSNKNENIVAVIMYIIIALMVIGIIYLVFTSNINLLNNETDDNNMQNQYIKNEESDQNKASENDNNINNNESNSSDSETENDINISEEKINEIENEKNKVTTPPKEDQIATYTTTLYDKEKTRIENINLAISKLNGVIIENGTEFSFNNTIGPMDESNGFKKATGFDSKGRKIKISGGGICQISSTLYNTALIAGFEITERHPHSRRVYYVPKDKDATIFYGSLDLKFINNSGSKVRIDASATESTVTINLIKIS